MEAQNSNQFLRRTTIIFNYLKKRKFRIAIFGFIYFLINFLDFKIDELYYSIKKINTDNEVVISLEDGNKISVNLRDKGIAKELYLQKKREIFSSEFLRNFIKEDEVIIDIGANIGYYVIIESSILKNGKIYAIEPMPSNMELLEYNVKLNNIENIELFQYAIGEENSSSKMYLYDRCNISSFNKDLGREVLEEVDVEILTLDRFIELYMEEYPSFIRMDIEGYEYHLFKGATKLLKNGHPLKLKMEIHSFYLNKPQIDYILHTLENNKFEIKAIILDPQNHNISSLKILNYLRENMGLPQFGISPLNSYETLKSILYTNCFIGNIAPIVFFERK